MTEHTVSEEGDLLIAELLSATDQNYGNSRIIDVNMDIEQSLARIKNYRKTINKRIAKGQSIIATESGRTYHELILEELFKITNIQINTETIFCFNCNRYFFHGPTSHIPSGCPICKKTYDNTNAMQFSRPDFILNKDKQSLILYVNGGIHGKKKFQNKDYHQVKHLLENKIKVIVIENDMIECNSNDILAAFCKMVDDCVTNEEMYTIYRYSSEPFQRILKNVLINSR